MFGKYTFKFQSGATALQFQYSIYRGPVVFKFQSGATAFPFKSV